MSELTLDRFEAACDAVAAVTRPTPLIYSEYFSGVTGSKVYFKPENMQRTGAYKIRGAYYKISTLTPEERAHGLATASAGRRRFSETDGSEENCLLRSEAVFSMAFAEEKKKAFANKPIVQNLPNILFISLFLFLFR